MLDQKDVILHILEKDVFVVNRSAPSDPEAICPSDFSVAGDLKQVFFGVELDKLVELKSLRRCFTLLNATEPNTLSYAAIVEQLFSATFYDTLWTPYWTRLVNAWLGEPLAYTITQTPFRKFKAVFPWLFSACQETVLLDCLCAELLASLFYLSDDVIDDRSMRYGKETAYYHYGRAGMEDSWKRAHQLDSAAAAPFFEGDKERRRLWKESLEKIEASQSRRFDEWDGLPFRAYRDLSIKRTGFLGDWWQLVATRVGNDELIRLLHQIYPLCVFVGQLRNDLCNIDEREEQKGGIRFSDLTQGRITAVTILLREWARESASSQDRSWLRHKVWQSERLLRPEEVERLSSFCRRAQIVERLTNLVEHSLQQIKEAIHTSALTEDHKALWSGWVFRQYQVRVIEHAQEGDSAAHQFIQAVKRLSSAVEAADQRSASSDAAFVSPILQL